MIAALTKWKVAVYLTAIFGAGLVSGWMIARKNVKQTGITEAIKQAVAPINTNDFSRWAKSSIYKVGLTPEQKQEADRIIEKHALPMKTMQDEHMSRFRLAISNRNAELMALLTPEQSEQFKQILEKERRERRDDRDRRSEREKKEREKRERSGTNALKGTNDCDVTNAIGGQSQSPTAGKALKPEN